MLRIIAKPTNRSTTVEFDKRQRSLAVFVTFVQYSDWWLHKIKTAQTKNYTDRAYLLEWSQLRRFWKSHVCHTADATCYGMGSKVKTFHIVPDSKVHGANMGPIWGRKEPGGPHVGPINFAIWVRSIKQPNERQIQRFHNLIQCHKLVLN